MKKTFLLFAFSSALLAGTTAFTLLSDEWKADAAQAKISFELPGEGTKGTIGGLKTSIRFNAASPAESAIDASVDVSTLNTGVEGKDSHLKTADFFDAAKFPVIRFVSEKISSTAAGFTATGKLTMKDSTHTIDLPFIFEPKGDNEGTFKGTMEVQAGDYGVMKKSKSGKDKVVITIEVPVKK